MFTLTNHDLLAVRSVAMCVWKVWLSSLLCFLMNTSGPCLCTFSFCKLRQIQLFYSNPMSEPSKKRHSYSQYAFPTLLYQYKLQRPFCNYQERIFLKNWSYWFDICSLRILQKVKIRLEKIQSPQRVAHAFKFNGLLKRSSIHTIRFFIVRYNPKLVIIMQKYLSRHYLRNNPPTKTHEQLTEHR